MKILVCDVRALHLGYLGCYGNHWVGTPNLDRLASQGIVADWHFADTPLIDLVSTPEIRSAWFTQMEQSGVRLRRLVADSIDFAQPVIESLPWLMAPGPALLWVQGPNLAPPWNLPGEILSSYFEEEDDEPGLVPWPDPGQGLFDLSEEDLLRLQNTYAAAVTYWDARLGDLVEHLDDSVGLVVTAGSGLPLGEHGMIGFTKPWLHDELIHLPLVLRPPDRVHAGLRHGLLTQPEDLFAWLGQAFQGDYRFTRERGEAISRWRVEDEEEWAVRSPSWAMVWPRSNPNRPVQLYAKPEDRLEVNNLSQQHQEMVEEWQRRIQSSLI